MISLMLILARDEPIFFCILHKRILLYIFLLLQWLLTWFIHWAKLYRPLRKMFLYSELFWSVFSCIWTGYNKIRSISPYSIGMWENTDQNYFEYRHFLRSGRTPIIFHSLLISFLDQLTWDYQNHLHLKIDTWLVGPIKF